MRFGIMDMQIGSLVPPGLGPGQAMEHVKAWNHAALVRQLAGAGFDLVELGGDLPLFFPQAFSAADIDELAAAKRELGLSYTVHLPLWSVEPSTPQQAVRAGSVRALVENIQATLPLDPEVYVLHSTGALAAEFYRMRLPEMARALALKQFESNAASSLRTILSETGIPSRRLAIETIEFPLELLLELAETFNLSLTFDTGHILAGFSGPVEFFDALERCLPRLGEVHLHDSALGTQAQPAYGRDHQSLGEGALDLPRLLQTLHRARFEGPIIFELTVQQALASLALVRSSLPGA